MIVLQIVVLKSSILHPKFREIGQLVPEPEKFLRGFPKYGHGGHFGHVTWISGLVPPSYRYLTYNLGLIGQAVSEEMFYGTIHVYCPNSFTG